jgi:prephenate dehydrogenase
MSEQPLFGKVVVFGVGLIGGSFALALKAAGQASEIVGFGRTLSSLNQALQLGIVDRAGFNAAQEVSDADLVLIATPVGKTAEIMARIASSLGSRTVVTDAGSTKEDVVAAARLHFGGRIGQFVPGHPIAGAENSGALAARADLYRQKQIVLTPLPENSPLQVARVRSAWECCGGLVRELPAGEHDRIFAAVSHLPHLLSFALVHELAERDNRETLFAFAASGFATSRGLPRAIRKCGATSAWPTAALCSTNSTATAGSSTTCAMPCNAATARASKRPSPLPGRRAVIGPRNSHERRLH